MALVPWPPVYADLIASCSKPEAITGNPSAPGIAQTTVETVLRQEADAAVAEALSDRIGVDVTVAQIDEGFAGHVIARALRRLMAYRGYNRQAGADDEIVELAKRADAFMEACSPGAGGKRITPRYLLNTPTAQQDSIRVRSFQRADAWALSTSDPRYRT